MANLALLLGPGFSRLHCSLNITSTQVVAMIFRDLCFHQRAPRHQAKPRARQFAKVTETAACQKTQQDELNTEYWGKETGRG